MEPVDTPVFNHQSPARIGVLLTNLGTPDAPTAKALRPYLKEFLSDRRVVDLPRALWWPILNLIILTLRPRRSAHAYAKVWTEEGSPLLVHTRRQAEKVRERLARDLGDEVVVEFGFRYGQPSISSAIQSLIDQGARRMLVLPLYPQYSATTTASAFDAVFDEFKLWRCVPELHTVGGYHDHPGYIGALAAGLHALWTEDGKPSRLLVSFHGLPERYVAAGDPYEQQCRATAALLSERLEIDPDRIDIGFQSRFGREPWIGLETAKLLSDAGRAGTVGLDVICPGFAADCLETLEEIAIAGSKIFTKSGGSGFRYVPALNRRPEHIAALAEIAIENMVGWLN